MEVKNLWDILTPIKGTIERLKEDYKRGITPQLPYFIIDQENLKKDLKSKIEKIDASYLQKTFVIGHYGNGKTNVLKYLDLFTQTNFSDSQSKIIMSFKRTDVDKPDIFLTLLTHIEFKLIDYLIESISEMNNNEKPFTIYQSILNKFKNFEVIKDYARKISETKDKELIKELIYLGTGRLYTVNHWKKFGLRKLSDFDRREIFVLFLNILAYNKVYIIFGIDELEKMFDKSKIRFRNFLTSFRELLDLSSFINGHLVIVTMTSDTDNYKKTLGQNDAFYSRIQSEDLQVLKPIPIDNKEYNLELIRNLSSLFNKDVNDRENEIYSVVKREFKTKKELTNRNLVSTYVAKILSELNPVNTFNLIKELTEASLLDLFEDKKNELELFDRFKDLSQKIFEPFRFFLAHEGYSDVQHNVKIRSRQIIIPEQNKLLILNFSDTTFENDCIIALEAFSNYKKVTILKSIDNSENIPEDLIRSNIEFKDFYPRELFILFQLYEENNNFTDDLSRIINGLLGGVL